MDLTNTCHEMSAILQATEPTTTPDQFRELLNRVIRISATDLLELRLKADLLKQLNYANDELAKSICTDIIHMQSN